MWWRIKDCGSQSGCNNDLHTVGDSDASRDSGIHKSDSISHSSNYSAWRRFHFVCDTGS
jgi:hypothetical protein